MGECGSEKKKIKVVQKVLKTGLIEDLIKLIICWDYYKV